MNLRAKETLFQIGICRAIAEPDSKQGLFELQASDLSFPLPILDHNDAGFRDVDKIKDVAHLDFTGKVLGEGPNVVLYRIDASVGRALEPVL